MQCPLSDPPLRGQWEKTDDIMWALFIGRVDVLRTNKSAFVFYVFILFILRTNALLRENKEKTDVEKSGNGGRTATDTGYLKPLLQGNICSLGKFFSHQLTFKIGDKRRERMTSTNTISSGHCHLSTMLATEMETKLCFGLVFPVKPAFYR